MRSPRPGADWDVNHFNFCPAGYECVGDWMKNCEPGFYSSHNLGHCMICPVKHFCPRPHEIFKCPDDAMAMHGVQECEYPPGHKNHRSRRAVDNCSLNQYIDQGGNCQDCKAGHKCDGKVFTRCAKTKVAAVGSGTCTGCSGNQVPTTNQDSCTDCPTFSLFASKPVRSSTGMSGCHLRDGSFGSTCGRILILFIALAAVMVV